MVWKYECCSQKKNPQDVKEGGSITGLCQGQIPAVYHAESAIIPLADILGLGKEGHINTPGTIGSPNWEWHLPDFVQAKKELQKFGRLIVDTKR